MNIETLRTMPYMELQRAYVAYLEAQGLSRNTIATSKNDAFYLLKNDSTVDFWALLDSPDFEEEAKKHLRQTLSERSHGNIEANLSGYMSHLRRFRRFAYCDDVAPSASRVVTTIRKKKYNIEIPRPSVNEVQKYLSLWDSLENYRLQEAALNRLFCEYAPQNTDIADILLKAATLNDFYSTNIFSIYPVAKHILALNIDERLRAGDISLVDEIKEVEINGKTKQFYSFATKYCSHHNPADYPIYDSYVDDVLLYFRNKDSFASFRADELKHYNRFKDILVYFQTFYGLSGFTLKQLDQYLWQLGKEYFPKRY